MEPLFILIGAYIIADAILFVNGYRSSFFHAKTDLEKQVRKRFFNNKDIEWEYDKENPPGWFARWWSGFARWWRGDNKKKG